MSDTTGKLDPNNYAIYFKPDIDALRDAILKLLSAHCDKKLEAFFKKEREKNDKHRAAVDRHNKQIDKFLLNQEKLVKALLARKK